MKLSQMNSQQLMDGWCAIAEPILEIINDDKSFPALFSCLQKKQNKVSFNTVRFVVKVLPVLLSEHREAVFRIAGALNGKSPEELKSENGFKLMKEVRECIDQELLAALGLSATMEQGSRLSKIDTLL